LVDGCSTGASSLPTPRHADRQLPGPHSNLGGPGSNALTSNNAKVTGIALKAPGWTNTTILDGDLVEAVNKLKQTSDGNILMHGYGPVAKTLVRHNLLDELYLWIHPHLAGVGEAGDLLLSQGLNARLNLLDVQRFASGVVILSYRAN
jgi:dihydrofolate reductase